MVLEGNFYGQGRATIMLNYFSRQTKCIQRLNCPQESVRAQGSKEETAIAPGQRCGQGSLVPDGNPVDGFLCEP